VLYSLSPRIHSI